MIIQQLQAELERRIKASFPQYLMLLNNIWGAEHLLILFPDVTWVSPIKEEEGWEPLKGFKGIAAIVFPTERMESFDMVELISLLVRPIEIQLDPATQPGKLSVKFSWSFNAQRDEMGEFNITTQLVGAINGTLYRKE